MCEHEIQLSQIRDVLLGPTEVPGNYALLDLNQIHICVSWTDNPRAVNQVGSTAP